MTIKLTITTPAPRRKTNCDCGECKTCKHREYMRTYRRSARGELMLRQSNYRRRGLNLTVEEYDALFEAQNGVCAICGNEETTTSHGKVRLLSADHDHETGQQRGLLCCDCNRAIGQMKDDPERLRAAADYIESWK